MKSIKQFFTALLTLGVLTSAVQSQQYNLKSLVMRIDRNVFTVGNSVTEIDLAKVENIENDPFLYSIKALSGTKIKRAFMPMTLTYDNVTPLSEEVREYWVVTFETIVNPELIADTVRELPGVLQAYPLAFGRFDSFWPNDTLWDTTGTDLWGYYQSGGPHINAPAAWDTEYGDPSQLIACLDTGIDTFHVDFNYNQHNKIQKHYNTVIQEPGHAQDNYAGGGHGTLTAGVIGAYTNNSTGITGVLGGDYSVGDYGSSIINVRISYSGGEVWTDLTLSRGILYARNNNAAAINMSLSDVGEFNLSRYALGEAYRSDIPAIASMGNKNNGTPRYPAAFHDVTIAVGAVTNDGYRWDDGPGNGSCWGNHIDVMAPTRTKSTNKYNSYEIFGGVSNAVPFVSGLVGMIRLLDPDASVAKIEAIIRASGDRYPDYWNDQYGSGLVDCHKAITLLETDGRNKIKKALSSPSWTELVGSEHSITIGSYVYSPVRVEYGFETDEALDTSTVVWVESEDSNGTLYSLQTVEQMNNIGFGAADPSTFILLSGNRISGKIITYTYKKYNSRGQHVDWEPREPSEISISYTQWGKFVEPPPQPPTAPTGLWGDYFPPDQGGPKTWLEWNRNPPDQGVDKYWLERALEEGEFITVKKGIPDPGSGSKVTYWDYMWVPPGTEYLRYKVCAHNDMGWGPYCDPVIVECGFELLMAGRAGSPPSDLTMDSNYPNPFNPTTQIRFGLPSTSHVRLQIMNIRGQTVQVLVDEDMPAGWHTVTWDGKNESGREVASGIYLYLIEADNKKILKRLTLIR